MIEKRVSVLIGAYNAEATIARALDSIIEQTYKDWVILICDDGSCDNTLDIIQKYKKDYPKKVEVYYNEVNQGLTYTLNRLLELAKTEYAARMDVDDVSMKERLEKQVTFLDAHNEYAFVGSIINKFDENGTYGTYILPEKPDKKDFLWNNPFVHPSVMFRTSVIKEVNGYRNINKTVRCEDYDLWFRLYSNGYRGYNIQKPLLKYYEGKESYSKRKFKYRLNEARVRLEGYKEFDLMPIGLIYALKPILVGILPSVIVKWKKKREIR